MGWIIVNKDVLAELNWLLELQSRSGDKWRKDGHESLSEGKQAERKMKKIVVAQSTQRLILTQENRCWSHLIGNFLTYLPNAKKTEITNKRARWPLLNWRSIIFNTL